MRRVEIYWKSRKKRKEKLSLGEEKEKQNVLKNYEWRLYCKSQTSQEREREREREEREGSGWKNTALVQQVKREKQMDNVRSSKDDKWKK